MRAFSFIAAGALLLAGGLSISHALGAAPPNGWGAYTFGMTPEQARAVPGVTWRKDLGTPAMVMMTSLPTATDYGPDTTIILTFNGDRKLQAIRLGIAGKQPAAECEKVFQETLRGLDRKYGAFAPGGADDIDWFAQDAIVRSSLLYNNAATALSASRSRYWLRTILPNISGIHVEAEAKHAVGPRAVEALMYQKDGDGKDGKDGCHQTIAFTADMPSKAQQQAAFKLAHVLVGMEWHWAEVDHRGRGFSAGPMAARYATGAVENFKLAGRRFTADLKRTDKPDENVRLTGTRTENKITAHAANAADDFPTDFEGSIQMFPIAGEPVDVYEILLTGQGARGTVSLGIAAYHRNSPHPPSQAACKNMADSVTDTRGTVREMTYGGALKALGCPS